MNSGAQTVRELLRKKRDGGALTEAESRVLLAGAASGEVDEPSLAALLASIWFQGMAPEELAGWTRGMVASGGTLDLRGLGRPVVDKHSTGGIGDKVSLPLAPLLAAAGCTVPMISGRGLGHTGGTLDKLMSVPGVDVDLDEDAIARVCAAVGCAICAQTSSLAPADRVLYALRDRVELVESIPLIASSIVSKKLAEGLDALVLDVKTGSGAFLRDPDDARTLARTMVALGEAAGVRTSARLTHMGRPLGRAVGHALEIEETRAMLRGEGPADLVEITLALGSDLLVDAGQVDGEPEGQALLARHLMAGEGLERFERMLRAQGANGAPLPAADRVTPYAAPASGWLEFTDAREVGHAVRALGGGRAKAGDTIDPAVGLVWRVVEGDPVEAGEPLVDVHHRGAAIPTEAVARLERALRIREDAPSAGSAPPLLVERVLPDRDQPE